MGRDWTNVKFEFEGRRDEPIAEASANPRTQKDVLRDFIEDRWDAENAFPMENIDVMYGGPSKEKLRGWITEFFEEFDFLVRAAAVRVSDSAHAGSGIILEPDEDREAEIIEEFEGYEGAMGEDVSGMIYDEYRIRVDPSWYWD